ncbi:hypothetical protein [Nonomuraea typhae]|uniref:hypothetical protein n=1 Tax=Nonomuraea typhae TaxID=2603600 RepID=UPI0012FB2C4E|nr:hypothetical protein [Nonomuraea typhae]
MSDPTDYRPRPYLRHGNKNPQNLYLVQVALVDGTVTTTETFYAVAMSPEFAADLVAAYNARESG